jgi:hypothetical protein
MEEQRERGRERERERDGGTEGKRKREREREKNSKNRNNSVKTNNAAVHRPFGHIVWLPEPGGQKNPRGQLLQLDADEAPVALMKVPFGHGVGTMEPPTQNDPGGHTMGAKVAKELQKKPGVQLPQNVWPGSRVNVPSVQLKHDVKDVARPNIPRGHRVQFEVPTTVEIEPAEQLLHTEAPTARANDPRAHKEQFDAPVIPIKRPDGHGSDSPPGQYEPIGQAVHAVDPADNVVVFLGHDLHWEDPATVVMLPRAHDEQFENPAREKVPTTHEIKLLDAVGQ